MKTTLLIVLIALLSGCRKTYDNPPYKPSATSAELSVKAIRSRLFAPTSSYFFTSGDTNLFGLVVADETSGNFYREVYLRDKEGSAIRLKLRNSGGIYTGDEVRINLNGLYAVCANGSIYIDSVDAATNVVKISSGNPVVPRVSTLKDVLRNISDPLAPGSMVSQLVELNGVEFKHDSRGKCIGDAVSKTSVKHLLIDCSGSEMPVSTSGFANFAQKLVPEGNGKLVGIVTQYNNASGLCPRSYYDLQMSGAPCTGSQPAGAGTTTFALGAPVLSISEDFSGASTVGDFYAPGWINFNETGSVKWKNSLKAGSYRAVKASAYGTGEINTMWLITPPVVYHAGMKLSFRSGAEYYDSGHANALVCYVSTDFNGLNFADANWTALNGVTYADNSSTPYTGSAGLMPSGTVDLSQTSLLNGFTGNFFVAWRYSGSPKYDSNLYLDDIAIE
jgi:hypothetical protein